MPFIPVLAISRSQNIRIGSAMLGVGGSRLVGQMGDTVAGVTPLPTYVDVSGPTSRRDLAHHMTLGAIVTVGPLANISSPYFWSAAPAVTAGSGLSVNVASGTLVPRFYGTVVAGFVSVAQPSVVVPAATNLALAAADPVLDRTDLVYASVVSGAFVYGVATGVGVTAGSSGANTVPGVGSGQVPVAWLKVLATATGPTSITAIAPTS